MKFPARNCPSGSSVFVATLLSPVFGDEPAGASAVAGAWATVKNVGLSASALSVLQGLTMQLGYAVP